MASSVRLNTKLEGQPSYPPEIVTTALVAQIHRFNSLEILIILKLFNRKVIDRTWGHYIVVCRMDDRPWIPKKYRNKNRTKRGINDSTQFIMLEKKNSSKYYEKNTTVTI